MGTQKKKKVTSMQQREKSRMKKIVAHLKKMYPDSACSLRHHNPFQLMISTILSAQCTDARVNIVTRDLFKKHKRPEDFAALSARQIEKMIHSTGFYRNKAKNIKAACKTLIEEHGGVVPREMDQLVKLGGVGRKTANVILGTAFGISEGIVVDTHVTRLSNRMGFTRSKNPIIIERDLTVLVAKGDWIIISHLMIDHGRSICPARSPKCDECRLKSLCPWPEQSKKN